MGFAEVVVAEVVVAAGGGVDRLDLQAVDGAGAQRLQALLDGELPVGGAAPVEDTDDLLLPLPAPHLREGLRQGEHLGHRVDDVLGRLDRLLHRFVLSLE